MQSFDLTLALIPRRSNQWLRRGKSLPEVSRLHKTADYGPPVSDELVYKVADALDEIAKETGKTCRKSP